MHCTSDDSPAFPFSMGLGAGWRQSTRTIVTAEGTISCILTIGERDRNQLRPPNDEHQRSVDAGTDAAWGSCTGRPDQSANNN